MTSHGIFCMISAFIAKGGQGCVDCLSWYVWQPYFMLVIYPCLLSVLHLCINHTLIPWRSIWFVLTSMYLNEWFVVLLIVHSCYLFTMFVLAKIFLSCQGKFIMSCNAHSSKHDNTRMSPLHFASSSTLHLDLLLCCLSPLATMHLLANTHVEKKHWSSSTMHKILVLVVGQVAIVGCLFWDLVIIIVFSFQSSVITWFPLCLE